MRESAVVRQILHSFSILPTYTTATGLTVPYVQQMYSCTTGVYTRPRDSPLKKRVGRCRVVCALFTGHFYFSTFFLFALFYRPKCCTCIYILHTKLLVEGSRHANWHGTAFLCVATAQYAFAAPPKRTLFFVCACSCPTIRGFYRSAMRCHNPLIRGVRTAHALCQVRTCCLRMRSRGLALARMCW